jgi:ABC-type multidrug transport system fused ATPase/permease subunit
LFRISYFEIRIFVCLHEELGTRNKNQTSLGIVRISMPEKWWTYLKQGLSHSAPEDRFAGQEGYGSTRESLRYLQPYLLRHWRNAVLGVFLILFASLLTFPQPLITRYIVDDVILKRQLGLLAGAIGLLIALVLAEKLAKVLEDFTFARFEQGITLDIQQNLLDRVLRFPKSFFDEIQTGYLMSRLSDDAEGLRWFFSSTVVYVLSNLIRFAGGVGFLFYLEWRLAVIVLVILPGILFAMNYFARKMHVLSHRSMEQEAHISGRMQEALSSAPLIKSFTSEEKTRNRLVSELKRAFQISLEQTAVNSVADMAIGLMPAASRGIALALGAYWVIQQEWTLGSLLAFQGYLGYVFGPAQFLATANLQLQKALAALQRIWALFRILPEENSQAGVKVDHLKGELEFRDVSFSYNGRDRVLDRLSFKIGAGEQLAMVGPSGVGKTTLLSLILCFYRPTSGEIYFDGRPASGLEVTSLRKRIGYVSQNSLLLSGTIMENLRYGNPDARNEEIIQAARTAEIHDFISSLTSGYNTDIGEKGIKLSEGQKQRLCIARALVKAPDILVLDEPTSSLDGKTEESILGSLPAFVKNKTLLIVSNKLSTLRHCDRILLLDENKRLFSSTHEQLMDTNEYYRSLITH